MLSILIFHMPASFVDMSIDLFDMSPIGPIISYHLDENADYAIEWRICACSPSCVM